jgi:SH3-like domain-containing protein
MQASFVVAGFRLLLLLVLTSAPGLAQTTSPPPSNLATQHPSTSAARPVAPKPAATPVVKPHGETHAQKPPAKSDGKTAGKSAGKSAGKPVGKPVPPPVVVAPAPEPAAPPPPEAQTKGSVTGNPLPRFAALRTDEVNLRRGPGTRYPIDWLYKRRDLPVEILREFEVWRLIVDPDGIKGWVHQATLTGRRSFIVTGEERVLRHEASDTSAPVARLKPGVIGHIRSCDAGSDWCQMQVGEYRGYLKRDQFWGALPNEAIND